MSRSLHLVVRRKREESERVRASEKALRSKQGREKVLQGNDQELEGKGGEGNDKEMAERGIERGSKHQWGRVKQLRPADIQKSYHKFCNLRANNA